MQSELGTKHNTLEFSIVGISSASGRCRRVDLSRVANREDLAFDFDGNWNAYGEKFVACDYESRMPGVSSVRMAHQAKPLEGRQGVAALRARE